MLSIIHIIMRDKVAFLINLPKEKHQRSKIPLLEFFHLARAPFLYKLPVTD